MTTPVHPQFSGPRQLGLGRILLLFAWPLVWYSFLIYILARPFIPEGGLAPTWISLSVLALGPAAELTVAAILLHREKSAVPLRERIRLRWPRGRRSWIIASAVFVGAFALSMAVSPLNRLLASVPGFVPPAWWPPGSNPTVEIHAVADVFPDVALAGNWGFFLLYFLIGLVFNIFGEELYYRGYLLPRMRGVFGRFDWVANGILFTLKHFYQRWLYPSMLVGGLAFAFAAGPLASLPLAMLYHWAGNFLFPLILLFRAVAGVG